MNRTLKMNRVFLTGVLILASLLLMVCTAYACPDIPPVSGGGSGGGGGGGSSPGGPGGGGGYPPACGGEPVYLQTGEYYLSTQDLFIRGRTLPIVLKRYYWSGPKEGIVYFDESGSYDPDGYIVALFWEFPADAYDTVGTNTRHTSCRVTTGGEFIVRLKVQDNRGVWSLPKDVTYTVPSSASDSRFGYGWDMNYNLKVRETTNPNTIILLDGETRRLEYTLVPGSNPKKYKALPGYSRYDFLVENQNGTYTLCEKHGTKLDFDIDGCLSAITDRHDNSITFGYNGTGEYKKLTTITDDLGRNINLTYNSSGLLYDVNDFASRIWKYRYDSSNNLHTVTGPVTDKYPSGLTTTYGYDSNHNLTSVKDPNDQTWLTNYYDANMVKQQVYRDGTFKFSYNPGSNETTVTDRRDVNTTTVYNNMGYAISRTIYTKNLRPSDPPSYITSYVRNSEMEITRVIFPAGNCIDYTYDANGNVTGIYRKTSSSKPNDPNDPNVIATIYTYEPRFNFVKTITDPRCNVFTITYDYEDPNYGNEVGNLMKITFPEVDTPDGPANPVVSATYNSYGQAETIVLPDGTVIKGEYGNDKQSDPNNYGKLVKVIVDYGTDSNCLNITTEFEYDALGRVVEVNDPNGNITKLAYNALDQLTKTTAPAPYNYATGFSYDKCKMLSKVEREIGDEPNQITSFTYNIVNKLKTMTDPLNYITKYGYDKNDNLSDVNDAEENNTHYQYDERDLLWKVTDANGRVTEYSYDKNGNLKEIKDPNNNTTTYAYDGFGRLIKITYPNDSNEVFGHDKNSNIISKKNRKGETILYKYDVMNRLIDKKRPNDPNITFLYDIAGRLCDVNDMRQVTDGGGITHYYYDQIGRVTKITNPELKTVTYEYDNLGRRTKLKYPDNIYSTRYEYDALSRLKKIKVLTSLLAQYEYDELSRRTLVTYYNGTNATYEYDIGNKLKKLTNNLAGGKTIVFDYSKYDKVGNRLRCKIDTANAQVYAYDKLYQITFVDYNDGSSTGYYYDKLGSRTKVINGGTTNYTSNKLNQYAHVGGVNYTYDDNGNLTFDGVNTYIYDCENRLIEVKQGQTTVVAYKYDFMGRRVRKTVGGATVTRYCYDGDQVIIEYNSSGSVLRRYFYGLGIDEPIRITATNIGTYYYHFDGLGSVVALSNTSGNVVERYEYDVFGEPNRTSSVGNPYMFTGRNYDSETGLYYYRARYYNPKIGRFLQTDPVKYYDSMNLYQYCLNNPVNFTDPYGLKGFWKGVGDFFKGAWETIKAAIPGGWTGDAGTAVLEGGTSILAYKTAIESLCEDPDFISSPSYGKLKEIATIPADDGGGGCSVGG